MKRLLLLLTVGFAGGIAAHADLMPSFVNVPTGWTTDRYAPASFANVGTYQGRSDVLGIGISSADALALRPAGYNNYFYNTQGKSYVISGGAGSSISADLYIQSGWDNGANGNVRSDMWGVINDPSAPSLQYPIIGFTNYGGAARYQVWDETIGWVALATPVCYGGWAMCSIEYTGASYQFFINGIDVYSDTAIGTTTTGFGAVIMQAYNFGDPGTVPGANAADYTAHWSNPSDTSAAVPEPSSWLLLGSAALLVSRKIRKRVP